MQAITNRRIRIIFDGALSCAHKKIKQPIVCRRILRLTAMDQAPGPFVKDHCVSASDALNKRVCEAGNASKKPGETYVPANDINVLCSRAIKGRDRHGNLRQAVKRSGQFVRLPNVVLITKCEK